MDEELYIYETCIPNIGDIVKNEDNDEDLSYNGAYYNLEGEIELTELTFKSNDDECTLVEIDDSNQDWHNEYVEEIEVDYGYQCDLCEQIFTSDTQLMEHMSSYLKCKVCDRVFCNVLVFNLHKTTHITTEIHKCEQCSATFALKSNFERHNLEHKVETIDLKNSIKINCRICKQNFNGEEELQLHMQKHATEENLSVSTYECAHCSKYFTKRSTFITHIKLHTGEKPFTCTKCGKSFRQKCYLNYHMSVHDSDSSFQCDTCQCTFKSKDRLARHIKDQHILNKQYICPFCDKKLKSCYTLQNHIKLHTKEGLFSCNLCGKQYSAAGNLQSHMRSHTDPKPYTCKFCDSTFKEKGNWKRHMKKHFEDKIQCEYCQNHFSIDYYQIHLRMHTGEKPYECTYCGKRFMQCSGLKSHLISHTNEKPYACSYCDKKFAFRSHRQRHMMSHTGGSFLCWICNRSFTSKYRLRDHLKIHTGERPYECKQCGRKFTQKSNLFAHERIHSGKEKPFKCSLCDLRFYTNSSLKSHLVSHRDEKMFACEACDKTFKHKSSLNGHVLGHIIANKCNICNKTFSCKTNLVKHVQKHAECEK